MDFVVLVVVRGLGRKRRNEKFGRYFFCDLCCSRCFVVIFIL